MEELHRIFNRARIDDRKVNELVGLCQGLLADGILNQAEIEYLQKWLVKNAAYQTNSVIGNLLNRVDEILADKQVNAEEGMELLDTLKSFSGGDFELGELQKSSSLPIDHPPPDIVFAKAMFCFTGTFAFGSRRDCEKAVAAKGAIAGSLTMQTNYLVVGITPPIAGRIRLTDAK
jgi:NAD-dependent DNA ligase